MQSESRSLDNIQAGGKKLEMRKGEICLDSCIAGNRPSCKRKEGQTDVASSSAESVGS